MDQAPHMRMLKFPTKIVAKSYMRKLKVERLHYR